MILSDQFFFKTRELSFIQTVEDITIKLARKTTEAHGKSVINKTAVKDPHFHEIEEKKAYLPTTTVPKS